MRQLKRKPAIIVTLNQIESKFLAESNQIE